MVTRALLDHLISLGVDVPILAVKDVDGKLEVTLQGGRILEVDLRGKSGSRGTVLDVPRIDQAKPARNKKRGK